MITKRTKTVLVAGAMLASACVSHGMTDGTGDMHASIVDARAENARHLQACTARDALGGVMDELVLHENNMNGMMVRMDHAMNGMSHCSTGGLARISEGMSGMGTGMADHRSRLESAADIEMAHEECGAHFSSIDEMLQEMDGELGRMSCMGMGR